MKISEVRELNTQELHGELERLRRHLFDLRAQAVTEKLQDPNSMTVAKRDIARILTVMHQRGETNIEQYQRHLESTTAKSVKA